VTDRERGEGQQLRSSVAEHSLQLGELAAQHPGDHVQLFVDMVGVGLGEDGADGGGDHLGRALGDLGEQVAEEVDPAALDGGAGHGGLDRLSEAEVGVGDDQLHPGQASGLQAPQELGPGGTVLAVAHPKPRTSRRPSPHTPVATTTAWATTRRLTLALP
jgi:hypothetical protein